MSLFKRIGDNIRANINSLLDKAEDPVKMLEQYLRDMEDDIADAEVAVAKQIAVVKRFESSYKDAQAMAEKREAQALQALEQNREDLARKALEDKKIHAGKAADYKGQFEQARETADVLKRQLQEMKDELEKMKARKATLVARAEAAKAQKDINKVMSGFGKNTARKGFERMEEKVLQSEAEAAAGLELRGKTKSLDDELAELGGSSSDIDDELARLKARLNKDKE
jgi:phage shock protein A